MEKRYSVRNESTENYISRRSFLDDLIHKTTAAGLFIAVPGIAAAGLVGRKYNQEIETEKQRSDRLLRESYIAHERGEENREERQRNLELERKIREQEEAELIALEKERKALEELMYKELNEPGKFSFQDSSDRLILAKTIYCEGEEAYKHPEYMKLVGTAPVRRASLTGWDLKKVIGFKRKDKNGILSHAFSFMNPKNEQNKEFVNPLLYAAKHPEKREAWERAYAEASSLLRLKSDELDPLLTHFYVNTVPKPDWAYDRKPVETISFNGKTTRFYDIPKDIEYMARFS